MGRLVEKNVERLISEKGWTLYRLNKESGVSLTVLYNLGSKKQGPTTSTLVKIANALDVSIDELVKSQENEEVI